MLDYKELLRKYISLVCNVEGVHFIGEAPLVGSPYVKEGDGWPVFTQEEVDELYRLFNLERPNA